MWAGKMTQLSVPVASQRPHVVREVIFNVITVTFLPELPVRIEPKSVFFSPPPPFLSLFF